MEINDGEFGLIKGGAGSNKVQLVFENHEYAMKFVEFVKKISGESGEHPQRGLDKDFGNTTKEDQGADLNESNILAYVRIKRGLRK